MMRIQGIFLLVLLLILDWTILVLPLLYVLQLLLAHVHVSYNAGYGWIQSLTLIDTYSTYVGVILIPYFYGPQALEIQGKRPEALDELLKICRIHNMFPPEDNSVCIWLQNLKACLLALLFLLHLLLFQPISLVVCLEC